MIIRASYVGGDADRVRHLLDAENNEVVIERHDLDVACPHDLGLTLEMHAALAAANPRAKIKTVHVKCSPSRPLTEEGIRRLIDVVRQEHRIPPGHPMKVIVHAKGNRPMHLHLLFPAVNPATGRVLTSKLNYRADELASRILEIEFGETITPGPRIRKNEETLRERGEGAMAAILANYEPVRNRTRDSENDRQQGARTKMPPVEFRRLLAKVLASAGPALPVPRALARGGFDVAIGDRRDTLMVVHLQTGAAFSLQKSLKRMVPEAMTISQDDHAVLRQQARPLAQVVRDGLDKSHRRAEARLDREIRRGLFESAIDGGNDRIFVEARRKRARERPAANAPLSLRDQRKSIRTTERETRILEAGRIDRAFRAARILQSPRLRKAAVVLAASGALLAGAGFPLAVGAGFAAAALMESQTKVLRANANALIAKRRARASIPNQAPPRSPPKFSFDIIPKDQRILVGMAARHIDQGFDTELTSAISRVLGGGLMDALREFLQAASDNQKRVLASWAKNTQAHRFAAVSALRRGGEVSAAEALEHHKRRRGQQVRTPERERG